MTVFQPDKPLALGLSAYGGLVSLAPEERRRHLYIVGQTGTGKSTLLLNLIRQDLDAGEGLCLLDPHGDLAETVLQHLPRRRTNDLVYLDPTDADHPIGFNPLSNVPERLKPVVTDGVVGSFRHVWPDSWGPRLDYILTNAVRALLDIPGGTLVMLPRLLIDASFRVPLIERHVHDPFVRDFWLQEYEAYADRFRSEAISPIQNKIGKALMTPILRNMLAQRRSTITPRRLMDEGAIFICNLSKGVLGESTSHLLGALLVSSLAQAALSRADITADKRRPFHLYADEFQSFATESFGLILSESRKYALTLTLSHQFLAQVPDNLRAAVFGNVGSIVSFRVGAEDAPILADQLGLGNRDAVLDLQNFRARAKLLRNGTPTSPIYLEAFAVPKARRNDIGKLVTLSQARFGGSDWHKEIRSTAI